MFARKVATSYSNSNKYLVSPETSIFLWLLFIVVTCVTGRDTGIISAGLAASCPGAQGASVGVLVKPWAGVPRFGVEFAGGCPGEGVKKAAGEGDLLGSGALLTGVLMVMSVNPPPAP